MPDMNPMRRFRVRAVALGGVFLGLLPLGAGAYIDTCPSLGTVVASSTSIVILQVDKVSVDKRVVIYKKIADLKGKYPAEQIKHQITDGGHPREPKGILDWARPGRTAIGFINDKTSLTFIGRQWYESAAGEAPWWTMTRGCPELLYSYAGTVDRLRQASLDMVAGKEVVVPAVSYAGTASQGGFAMAIHYRSSLRGVPLCRLKASVKLTSYRPEQLVGPNGGTEADVPGLLEALQRSERSRRVDAVEELSRIGPPAKAAVPELVKALQDPDADLRLASANALAAIDPKNPVILPALDAELKAGPDQRKAAAEILGDLGAVGVAVLTGALKDPDAGVRWAAADSLGRIGPAAKSAVPALAAALEDKEIRSIVADALAGIGPEAKQAVPGLVQIVRNEKEPSLRYTAGVALVRIDKTAAGPAAPLLAEALRNPDGRYRHDAIMLLISIGPAGKEATPVLTEMLLRDKQLYARHMAALALGYGRDPRSVAPLLEALEKDSESAVRNTALQSIGLLGADATAAVPALEARLKDADVGARIVSAEALWRINKDAKKAVPVLVDALKDKNDYMVGIASGVLGRMGADAKGAVPDLIGLLKSPREPVRRTAAHLLKSIDPKAAAEAGVP